MDSKPDSLFGAVAVHEGFASEDEVLVALEAQKNVGGVDAPIGQILLEMGALNQAQIEAVLAGQARLRLVPDELEILPDPPPAPAPPARESGQARFVQQTGEPPRVNDEIVREPRPLRSGDVLGIGGAHFRFEGDAASGLLLVPARESKPADGPAAPESLKTPAPEAPARPPDPSLAAKSLPPAEPGTAPAASPLHALLGRVDRLASRILPRVHNHRKTIVALAALGLLATVLPWRIATNGNTVIGLQGPGWLTFWLFAVPAGCAVLLRLSRPVVAVEWMVIASSSGLAVLVALWKVAFPPAYAKGRGIGLYLALVAALLLHGISWLIRKSSSPPTAEESGPEPGAIRLLRWAKRRMADWTGKSANEKAAQIERRDLLLQEIGRSALDTGAPGQEADLARDTAEKLADAEKKAGTDLKARAVLKVADAKAKRALAKLGRMALGKGMELPGTEAKVAELRALEEKIGKSS